MKANAFVTTMLLSAWVAAGCAANPAVAEKSGAAEVTVSNGSSPANANAAHASMNDTDGMRRGFNHGNGSLWVWLGADSTIVIPASAEQDSGYEFKGFSRVKFGWWRGGAGRFTIEGRRLDAPAAPLRYSIHENSYGEFGFMPSYLYFPSEGIWEITGHLGDQSLTFVVRVVKEVQTSGR